MMPYLKTASACLACILAGTQFASLLWAQPEYEIISLGQMGESNSGGQAISPSGQYAAGFSDTEPFLWESGVGVTALTSAATRPFSMPQAVNDAGTIAGIGATTFFGSSALPIVWQDGLAVLVELPAGESLGRAYGINNSGLIVGSVDGGSVERAATFSLDEAGAVLTQTLAGGTLTTAFGVNNSGRIVGIANDPMNAAVTKGFYLDPGDTEATDIGALTGIGHNSAIAFGVSDTGLITGSSSFNAGVNGRAFLWSEADGMMEIGLPKGTSTASGRGVNSEGWVVGTAGGATAIPFLYDGQVTYRLQDVITAGGAGWDLVSGTSNGAFDIADDGTITGRGLLNGELTAFAMIRLPAVLLGDVNLDGVVSLLDVDPFVGLISEAEFQAEGDINGDGVVNLLDVDPFVALLTGA